MSTTNEASNANVKKHAGSCHCGAVRFEVEIDASGGSRCNCSICAKLGATGGRVKPAAFKLVTGEGSLGAYEWGHKIAKRFFCKNCGVYLYGSGHLAQLGGDFVSVNLNCLDDAELAQVKIVYWDGRHDNWQAGTRSTPWPNLTAGAGA
jgi:hypothetical protein